MPRKTIPNDIRVQVLTEAGYRCAVPTCRQILAMDIHHMVEVSKSGSNNPNNLIALCPTCHALYHRGTIKKESLYIWKAMLVSLNHAFDKDAIDNLLFLQSPGVSNLFVSGDGVLKFSNLIAAGLAKFTYISLDRVYRVSLTDRGLTIISAWKQGDRAELEKALQA